MRLPPRAPGQTLSRLRVHKEVGEKIKRNNTRTPKEKKKSQGRELGKP